MGKNAVRWIKNHQEGDGLDPVLRAYRLTRLSVRASQMHLKNGDTGRAAKAIKETATAGRAFVQAIPQTQRGMALKVVAALKSLADAGDDEAAGLIRSFFLTRKTVDGEWLRDLRRLGNAVEISASQPALAVECLKSILMSKIQPHKSS